MKTLDETQVRESSRVQAASNGAVRRRAEIEPLYEALKEAGSGSVKRDALLNAFAREGLQTTDPRLAECMARLELLEADAQLSFEEFASIVKPNLEVIRRILSGRAVIPELSTFAAEIHRIYEKTIEDQSGAVASSIPQLSRVDPERYGVSFCTIDGQRLSIGDADTYFSMQSCCKPISYCLALEETDSETVHRHVGCEPSGQSFNELALNDLGLPHNPMINAGAIMCSSMIKPGVPSADRFDHVMEAWRKLSGNARPGFSNAVYLSERQTADRNFAIGYSMREQGAFPSGTDLLDTLEFYFQCCSLEITADSMSIVAATLANGGICPTTGERVFRPETVQKCLSLMYSCGMYDFSGEWAFTVGLPAKSGISGAVMVVVPNVLGLCVWSPRLDQHGNSVRGVSFCRELVRTFNFHNYDNLIGGLHGKMDPRRERVAVQSDDVVALCWAASEGDATAIRRMVARGVAADRADYDGRTALHLAASEGHLEVVEYLLGLGVPLSPRDRWGGTPHDDAIRGGHTEIADLLGREGATSVMAGNGGGNDVH